MWDYSTAHAISEIITPAHRKLFGPITGDTILIIHAEVLNHRTSQSSWFFSHLKHVKRSAFQNKWIAVGQLAFQARKALTTFEKQALGPDSGFHPFFSGLEQ